MQVNSCVNPFIYATTIPDFKKTVKSVVSGHIFDRPEVIEDTTTVRDFQGHETIPFCEMQDFARPFSVNEQNTKERPQVLTL